MAIDPGLAAIIGSIAAGSTVWGGTLLSARVTRKKVGADAEKIKAEADHVVVQSALELTEALDKHATNLRNQLETHEKRSQEREARYEARIVELESALILEKQRCDALEKRVYELVRVVEANSSEISKLKSRVE